MSRSWVLSAVLAMLEPGVTEAEAEPDETEAPIAVEVPVTAVA